MIFITGDCHGDYSRFNMNNFPIQKELTKDDIVIVCGDFGLWHNDAEERWWFNWLSQKSFTIAFVDGNHENFNRLYSDEFPIVDFYGGKAHKIKQNVFHLMRGEVFYFTPLKLFTFGGASSHDIPNGAIDRSGFPSDEAFRAHCRNLRKQGIFYRVKDVDWWEQELPSSTEINYALQNLAKHDFKVDYVISHCLPQQVLPLLYRSAESDKLTKFFDTLITEHGLSFNKWYCGHYHVEDTLLGKYIIKYERIERIA